MSDDGKRLTAAGILVAAVPHRAMEKRKRKAFTRSWVCEIRARK